ncbi:MAG TPA: hypothetical protein PL073_13515 [Spirochaetota bacterium]|nr:hypothetical protein [Spirochaetota bacterium]
MSLHEPYGATASCLRWFCLKKKKNTICTSCFHGLRVVLDTKWCTVHALSCTHPMKPCIRARLWYAPSSLPRIEGEPGCR